MARIDRAAGQQHSPVLLGDRAGHHLGVQVEDELAEATDRLFAVIGGTDARLSEPPHRGQNRIVVGPRKRSRSSATPSSLIRPSLS